MTNPTRPRPVVLCVLDGWGFRNDAADNAVTRANAPHFRAAWEQSPHALLEASEEFVGLPKGQIGNSEVGHMNLGAGRVIFQDLPLIDRAVSDGSLAQNKTLHDYIEKLKASGGTCHLMGLASPGGVHAHQEHIAALSGIVARAGVPVVIHAFLDGRDVPPQSAAEQIAKLQTAIAGQAGVMIGTLCGRYYAMDRDKRWERVELAYDLLTTGAGMASTDAGAAIRDSYAAGVYDEFVKPVTLGGYTGMKDGDGVLFANFRADRAREILQALLDPAFTGFARKKTVHFDAALGMVEYSDQLNKLMPALFPPKQISETLGELAAKAGLKQLRIAETEKYPHVTFFFNGGREEPYPGEDRIMVPSPKVATYDLQPEMSASLVTDKVVAAIEQGVYDLIILNYANPDMVGHTGDFSAAVKAVEALDVCLGRLFNAVRQQGGIVFVTADHGNCETMHDPTTNGPHTAHTLEKVPAVLVGAPAFVKGLRNGKLADVAPTLLRLMNMPQPAVMDGQSLIVE
ncbi:MAG: 2,3-bisphosphoglycerate-independent phosphoglycerate mutase [Alphaproteobacteria bacterium]|nr:2,3-bisphosphoglycerate-independent phosphoglycerate mutase [Alphaproteobacteria bacterium]MBV8548039.1 2,3-bisphosphoglycerate-independent phosphoglycerate mutase [Alphaproteobacteria bacterium]